MKKILLLLSLGVILYSCKKSDNTGSSTTTGNFFQLNSDKRDLGTIPNTNLTMNNGAYSSPDEWQLSLGIKTACYKIAGLQNDEFEIYIDIWDKKLLKTQYTLVPGYSGGGSTAGSTGTASMGFRPFKIGGSGLTFFDAQSGIIKITKDSYGNLKTVEFTNIPVKDYNPTTYKASGRFSVN